MMNCSMVQALSVWHELEQAYYNDNGYGGNVAEIYAYRLMSLSPTAHLSVSPDCKLKRDASREVNLHAASDLYELLSLFSDTVEDCQIYIDGEELGEWFKGVEFDHRVNVKIVRGPA